MAEALDKILIDKDDRAAVRLVKGVVSDLLQDRIDMSQLIITKELGKKTQGQEEEELKSKKNTKNKTESKNVYNSKVPHVMLADKMRERDPATAPNIGDRVPFVIVKAHKNAKVYERAENPLYVLEHRLEIDYNYYLDHQLKKPLIRLFEPILKDPNKDLFSGEHTRNIYKSKIQPKKGCFTSFLTIKKT